MLASTFLSSQWQCQFSFSSCLYSLSSCLWSLAAGHITREPVLIGQQCQAEIIYATLPKNCWQFHCCLCFTLFFLCKLFSIFSKTLILTCQLFYQELGLFICRPWSLVGSIKNWCLDELEKFIRSEINHPSFQLLKKSTCSWVHHSGPHLPHLPAIEAHQVNIKVQNLRQHMQVGCGRSSQSQTKSTTLALLIVLFRSFTASLVFSFWTQDSVQKLFPQLPVAYVSSSIVMLELI